MPFWTRFCRQATALARHRGIAATGTAAVLVAIAGCAYAVASTESGHQVQEHQSISRVSDNRAHVPPKPLDVTSITPHSGASGVTGTDPITVTFAAKLSPATPLPRLYPKIPGSWQVSGDHATFTPQVGYQAGTTVTVTVPAGVRSDGPNPRVVPKASTTRFTTGSYSTLRLQQLLAQLGYLPVTFHPSGKTAAGGAKGQLAAAYNPPSGSFSWNGSYPSQLTSQWQTGADNPLVAGAVRAFEADHGLTMDGQAGPEVWSHLLTAAEEGKTNPHGYTYALATQGSSNESLQVWHDGKRILDTPANTGIAAAPTQDGTYPVYERLQYQVMKGTNPDGSHYADPVYWIAYFNGGDAVHGFNRASYGYYQSLGCVELPISTAKWLWPYMTYGTLVTVQGPVA